MKMLDSVVEISSANKNACKQCCTRKNCLINRLDENQVRELSQAMRHPKPLHKGERLFMRGDEFYSLYIIRSGSFKSYITDPSGDHQITGFHYSGDVLGMDGIDSGRHTYEVEALETCSVCTLPFNFFESVSDRNSGALYRQLMCAISGAAFKENHLLMVLGRMHAEQRLASFLLDVSQRMSERGSSAKEFNLSMPRHDIANYLGLAIETVSRLFRRFQDDGLISAERRYVRLLDKERLYSMIASDHRFSGLRNIA